MTNREVDQVMIAKGLANDPAFNALHFLIEPIPCNDGCPLGLYYPDTAAIILPPDASEGALLHELGHRHGHYYYNDLSEQYAENFRKAYQTEARALLYIGNHFPNLPKFEPLFEEGERGAIEIALYRPLTPDELYEIRSRLYSYPEKPRLYYGDRDIPFIRVEFTKGLDWLTITGAILGASVLGAIGLGVYAVYKMSKETPWATAVEQLVIGTMVGSLLAFGAVAYLKKTKFSIS